MESPIYETFTLPSLGKAYEKEVNPQVTLRSMSTMEELQRLSPSDSPYKVMSDIIEACMKEKPAIHVYDMTIADYEFLLHKLRIVTYGAEYHMEVECPHCNTVSEVIANLDSIKCNQWDDSIIEMQNITLPKTGHQIVLKFQTPHDIDMVSYKNREMKKRTKSSIDYSILFTVMTLIKTVDGRKLDVLALEEFVKQLPMKDINYIVSVAAKINRKVGLDTQVTAVCQNCNSELTTTFRITSEFFGPSIDI